MSDQPLPLRVLVVDDSPFVCRLLAAGLQSEQDIQVVGSAHRGGRAVELVKELRPDAVTLDLEMPGMSGLDVLDCIMHQAPTPVVVVSGVTRRAAAATLQALERGAVDYVLKYNPEASVDPATLRAEITAKVRMAARIKVIRSLAPARLPGSASLALRPGTLPVTGMLLGGELVVIGASTGGPQAVQQLLAGLPGTFGAAVVVVQHVPAPFTPVLVNQLMRQSALVVKEATSGDLLRGGSVFVAPGDRHLLIHGRGTLEVADGPKVGGHRPSIDVTMQAAAHAYGQRATGVILTGMGSDGARGLAAIHLRGGRTYAQDEASCVVSSMPSQAVSRGVVDRVGTPAEIARLLSIQWSNRSHVRPPGGFGPTASDRALPGWG